MCGIVGAFSTGNPIERSLLQRMTRSIAHRGPDGEGYWSDDHACLGHRRLSIVDLSGGAQPMGAERPVVVTFNGEIYNHLALRDELARLGHGFETRSDTEVVVEGSHRWWDALPSRLNGMFAYAAWDKGARRGLIARDRTGQKPLYYTHRADGSLWFASELKALLEHPEVDRKMDLEAIALYLTYEYVPYPWSAIEGIRKLPPGHLLEWKDGAIEIRPYAELAFGQGSVIRSDQEWIEATRASLSRSVERRLMSDVPLGVFLSGGIDSSAIVALMSDHRDPRDIRTFSIAFEDKSFDESSYAEVVAQRFGTQHNVQTFSAQALLDLLPEVTGWIDEPFGDASLLPTHLLSRFTRQHVTVALGGDGGDELFAGYETFRADSAARLYRRAPAPLRSLVRDMVHRLPVSTSNFSLDFVLKRFVDGADAVDEFRHVRWLSSCLPNTADDPLRAELREGIPDGDIYGVFARAYMSCPDPRHVQRLSYAYLKTYMAEDILTKVDRASMATSLEVRSPFLDPEFMSLVNRMPPRLKLHNGFVAKYALKKCLEADLPHEILYRKKKGFGIPVAAWLKGPLQARMKELLAPDRLDEVGLLDSAVVGRLVDEHLAGERDNRKLLWSLMMLEGWRERFDVRV